MYGLVNKAVEDLVCSRHGEDAWAEILARAEVTVAGFVSMEPYPDEVTYRLVGAASEVLGEPTPAVLEALGEHFIRYTAPAAYGELMATFGANMREFLGNLDAMHARVGLCYPKLRPPSFVVRDVAPGVVELEYHSTREHLAPMVVGLLRGLGRSFGVEARVEHVHGRERGGFDLFRVETEEAAA